MTSWGEWFEERRTEGLGRGLSLFLVAAGAFGLGALGLRMFTGGGGSGSDRVGKNVAALTLRDRDGHVSTLGEYSGQVVVVDFWATWCPPCRMSLPELAALQKNQDTSYKVVPVSLDREGFAAVLPFFQQNPALAVTAMVPADASVLDRQVGAISAIPTTLIVGRDGKVARAWMGFSPGRLDQELKAELAR